MTRRWLAVDAGVAVLTFGLTLGLLAAKGFGEPDGPVRELDAGAFALAALSALPLVARRFAPLATYLATAAGSLTLVGLSYPLDLPIGTGVAIFQLGLTFGGRLPGGGRHPSWPPRRWLAVVAAALFTPAVGTTYALTGYDVGKIWPELIGLALMVLGVWLTGDRARLRGEQIAALQEQAHRVERETERERRLAAAEERTRIARELHDSAGHAINVILVQAGAARLLQDRDPGGSLRAISTIEQVARDTITEIDRLVRVLRTDGGSERAPADPAAFEELIERHRAGGLDVASQIRGPRTALPRSVAWAAYRILQEALTNAARHGRGEADVSVWLGPDLAEITVTNPTGSQLNGSTGGGHGIVGMRERANLLGGALRTGAKDGVFRLHAELPYQEAAS